MASDIRPLEAPKTHFTPEFHAAITQVRSPMMMGSTEVDFAGNQTTYDFKINNARFAKVRDPGSPAEATEVQVRRIWATRDDWELRTESNELVDARNMIDPASSFNMEMMGDYMRTTDQYCIDALRGPVTVGATIGTTAQENLKDNLIVPSDYGTKGSGLTLGKINGAQRRIEAQGGILNSQFRFNGSSDWFLVCQTADRQHLVDSDVRLTSSDFQYDKILSKFPDLMMVGGVHIITIDNDMLPDIAGRTGFHYVYLYNRRILGRFKPMALQTSIYQLNDLRGAPTRYFSKFSANAIRMRDELVCRIVCENDAIGSQA